MTPPVGVEPARPFRGPTVVGSAGQRARAVLEAFPERTAAIAASLDGLGDVTVEPDLALWVRESFGILERAFPEVADYLEATADAFGVDVLAMFARSHRKVVKNGFVLAPGPAVGDGCSTMAGRHATAQGWIAKNRDNNQESLERQVVVEHIDPAWEGRRAVTVANLGGCMANSSGINSAGFAAVDTAVEVSDAPPGIFRAFLLDALLGRCTTVEEAIEIIVAVPHLGGTATIADATGAVATADLAPTGAVVEFLEGDGTVCRTNHFVAESLSSYPIGKVAARENSQARLESVSHVATGVADAPDSWPEFRTWVASSMISHEGQGALCKHEASGSLTIGTSVYGCSPPTMLTSLGPGCVSPWVEWTA